MGVFTVVILRYFPVFTIRAGWRVGRILFSKSIRHMPQSEIPGFSHEAAPLAVGSLMLENPVASTPIRHLILALNAAGVRGSGQTGFTVKYSFR